MTIDVHEKLAFYKAILSSDQVRGTSDQEALFYVKLLIDEVVQCENDVDEEKEQRFAGMGALVQKILRQKAATILLIITPIKN